MGRLIPTGIQIDGHSASFVDEELDGTEVCTMRCSCGFEVELKSGDKPWGAKEAEVRFQVHLDQHQSPLHCQ